MGMSSLAPMAQMQEPPKQLSQLADFWVCVIVCVFFLFFFFKEENHKDINVPKG